MSSEDQFLRGVENTIGKTVARHGYILAATEETLRGSLLTVRFERDDRWVNVVWDDREQDLTVRVGPHAGTRWGESIGEMLTKKLRERNFDVDGVLRGRAPGIAGELEAYSVLLGEYLSGAPHREKET